AIALATPPNPEPTTRATSGLNPASFASRKSFDSLTFDIISLNSSANLFGNESWSRHNRIWTDGIGSLHHTFGFRGARLVVVVHDHQRLARFDAVADFFRLLKADREINLVARNLATAAQRDDGVTNLVALDGVHGARSQR